MSESRYGRSNPWRSYESSILEAKEISVYEKMAYIVISSHATALDQRSFPSYSTIARKGSMSERKAKDAVKKLAELNLIVKIHRFTIRKRDGKEQREHTSNLYVIFPYDNPFNPYKEYIDKEGNVHALKESGAPDALPNKCSGAQHAQPPSAHDALPVVHDMHDSNKTSINKTTSLIKPQQQGQDEKHVVVIKEDIENKFKKKTTKKSVKEIISLADKHQVDLNSKIQNTYDYHTFVKPCTNVIGAIKYAIQHGDWEIHVQKEKSIENEEQVKKEIFKKYGKSQGKVEFKKWKEKQESKIV